MAKPKRYRLRFQFWLNVWNDDDMAVCEQIQLLKNERSFTQVVRDGIRLICDLRQGRVDVLKELFPDVVAKLSDKTNPTYTPDSTLKQDIEQILQLMQNKSEVITNAPKALQVPTFNTPAFDDLSNGELVIKKDTSIDAGKNFLQSMMNLQA